MMVELQARAESGILQFSEDWAGVFIRGDHAFSYAGSLQRVLRGDTSPIDHVVMGGLLALLSSCQQPFPEGTEGVQRLKEFIKCLPEKQTQSG